MASVCIVDSQDSQEWSGYITSQLPKQCTVRPVTDTQLLDRDSSAGAVLTQADVVMVIVSPTLTDTLEKYPVLHFDNLKAETNYRILIFCGTNYGDLVDKNLLERFAEVDHWKQTTVGSEKETEEMLKVVNKCVNNVTERPKVKKVPLPGMTQPLKPKKAATLPIAKTPSFHEEDKAEPRDTLQEQESLDGYTTVSRLDVTAQPTEGTKPPAVAPKVRTLPRQTSKGRLSSGDSNKRMSLSAQVHPDKIPCQVQVSVIFNSM